MAFGKNKDKQDTKTQKENEKKVPDEKNEPVSLGLVSDDILLEEVKRRKLGLYDEAENICVIDAPDGVLIAELKHRGVEFNPAIGKMIDDVLLDEIIRRKLGPYGPGEKAITPPTDDAVVKPVENGQGDVLYKAGKYTCKAGRGYNTGKVIYDYGQILTLSDDTFLKDLPYLKHFIPYKGTPEPSLTPYGAKFNKKVPKTGAARGANFKNHPALKGQGTAAELPDKPADN